MRANLVKQRMASGEIAINAWLSIGSSYTAEGMGHAGFHSATVDMQHGMLGFSDALPMLQALSSTSATPIVRVPDLNPAVIMQMLDAGAYGVICPMISTPEQAAALVSACRYPPIGSRSFGPSRGLLFGGADYVAHANDTVMAIPMIETREAFERIDEILAVDGVDMIYIGPNDMAFDLDGGVAQPRLRSEKAITHILQRAIAHNIPAGIFCANADEACRRASEGFKMVTPANDFGQLTRSAAAAVAQILDDTGGQSTPVVTNDNGY